MSPKKIVKRMLLNVPLAAALFFGCSEPKATLPPYKPVADIKQMMDMLVDPAADVEFGASGWVTTSNGSEERRPKNNDEWTVVQNNAMLLAESGNLLMMPPRAQDGGEWMKAAQSLTDKGQELLEAAQAKDVERMFSVGGELYDTCLHCHQ